MLHPELEARSGQHLLGATPDRVFHSHLARKVAGGKTQGKTMEYIWHATTIFFALLWIIEKWSLHRRTEIYEHHFEELTKDRDEWYSKAHSIQDLYNQERAKADL